MFKQEEEREELTAVVEDSFWCIKIVTDKKTYQYKIMIFKDRFSWRDQRKGVVSALNNDTFVHVGDGEYVDRKKVKSFKISVETEKREIKAVITGKDLSVRYE